MSKRIYLILALIFVFTNLTHAADPNLVGHWPFETDANDSAGNNDGTLMDNAAIVADAERGPVLGLDGSGDYVTIDDDSSLDVTQFSVSVWFKTTLGGGHKQIIEKRENSKSDNYNNFYLNVNDGSDDKISAMMSDGSSVSVIRSDGAITSDVWCHVVEVFDGTTHMMYVNGVLQSDTDTSVSSPYIAGTQTTHIGVNRGFGNYNYYFDGKIEDVRVYDRALSGPEVFQLYQEDTTPQMATLPSPVNGVTLVDPNVVLNWMPGRDADLHDVYFGTDFDDVNDADTTIYNPNDVYKGRQDSNSWDPCGLELITTYYWRIDEVNDANVWRGNIWYFKTPGPFIELSTNSFFFPADWDIGENPNDQILTIHNSGIGTLNWQITEDCNWLTVTPLTGSSTGEPCNVILSVDIAGLPEGEYQCDLTVSDPNANNDPQVVNVELAGVCFPYDHPDYNTWLDVDRPDCWCEPRQCHGDADNFGEGQKKWWASVYDLNVLLSAWNKPYADIAGQTFNGNSIVGPVPLICADFDHFGEGRKKWRCSVLDLNILLSNWNTYYVDPNCFDGY